MNAASVEVINEIDEKLPPDIEDFKYLEAGYEWYLDTLDALHGTDLGCSM